MAIAVRGFSGANTNTTPLVITTPAGTIDGDIVILVVDPLVSKGATLPGGFTSLNGGGSSTFILVNAYKKAASEGASYSLAVSGSLTQWVGMALSLSGCLASGFFDSQAANSNGSGTAVTCNGLTTAVANEMCVMAVAYQNTGTCTTPAGWTLIGTQAGTSVTIKLFQQTFSAPGAVSAVSLTLGTSGSWIANMFAFKPYLISAQFWTNYIKSFEVDS